MSDCLFCTLQSVRENILYENDSVYVIVDRFPFSNRHLLIIPKEHHDVFHKYDEGVLFEAVRVARLMVKRLNMESYNILQNNKNGQIIPHFHMHLIEANASGRLALNDNHPLRLSDSEYKDLVTEIQGLLAE